MTIKKYDSTVCRIAGNLLSNRGASGTSGELSRSDEYAVTWAVRMARAIVAEEMRQAAETAPPDHAPIQQIRGGSGGSVAANDAPILLFFDTTLGRTGTGGAFKEFFATPSLALLQQYAEREGLQILQISGLPFPREVREKITKLRATDQGVRRCRKGVTDEDLAGR